MSAPPIAILQTGLVTSVGLSAPASCAAFRAKVTNPVETRFVGSGGDWIMAHEVALAQPWRGVAKLAKMAAMAIEEVLEGIARSGWNTLPLLLCVAESDRPGRTAGLDDRLFRLIEDELDARFVAQSAIVPQGRVSVATALAQARALIFNHGHHQVLIAATDSLLSWPTLSHYDQERRLLSEDNSNGFIPGEGAGALLVGAARGRAGELVCSGIGFGREVAHIGSGEPLRGDGMSSAMKAALSDAGLQMQDMAFRITDVAGEHYYFKEAALAISRILRQRKTAFDIWHPAECTGEAGALAGASIIAVADAACRKDFANGPAILAHMANDGGQRAALTLHYRSG